MVIATGSTPRVPHNVPGIDLPHVVQGWDVLIGKATTGQRVALVSQEDSFQTRNVAEYLAERGKDVTIFHKAPSVGGETGKYSLGAVLSRLERLGVAVRPNVRLTEIHSDRLKFISSFNVRSYEETGFDTVVLVYNSVPNCELYDQLKADGSIPTCTSLVLPGCPDAWPRRRSTARASVR